MPRYKLTVAYDGTDFHGWQKQEPPGLEPLRTVQAVVERAVRMVVREPVSVMGASRTDAGVHARGQVAAFTTSREIPVDRMPAAITSRLPDDVQVTGAEIVADDFSPISDCTSKGYRYRLACGMRGNCRPPLFTRHYTAWTPYDLDLDRMNAAAGRIVGEHDFASFTRVNHGRETTVRTVLGCEVTSARPGRCRVVVSGTGFLYNMVRIIVGTLVEVGRGQLEPDDVAAIIAARDRSRAGPTMPPEGLCLEWVAY